MRHSMIVGGMVVVYCAASIFRTEVHIMPDEPAPQTHARMTSDLVLEVATANGSGTYYSVL